VKGAEEPLFKDGVQGRALDFSGKTFLEVRSEGDLEYRQKQSFQAWIHPDSRALSASLLFSRGNFRFMLEKGHLAAVIGRETLVFKGLGKIKKDLWTPVQVCLDQFSSKISISTFDSKGFSRTFSSRLIDPEGVLFIGGDRDPAQRYSGLMDEVKVFYRPFAPADFQYGFPVNLSLAGEFTDASLRTIRLRVKADNAAFMKIYQQGFISKSSWEKFKPFKILKVFEHRNQTRNILIVGEFKSLNGSQSIEIRREIPIPASKSLPVFRMPPPNVTLTTPQG